MIRPFTVSHRARGLVKPRTMPHSEVDKKRWTWQYARHDSIHSPVRFSLELQQAQAFRKMVISATRGYHWRNRAWSGRVRMPAQILSGCNTTNHRSIAGGEMLSPISWEVICSRGRQVRRAVSHYLQLIVGDTVRRPPSSQIRAGSCIAKTRCLYTDPGNRERERRLMPES
jgi:hypothetical protein